MLTLKDSLDQKINYLGYLFLTRVHALDWDACVQAYELDEETEEILSRLVDAAEDSESIEEIASRISFIPPMAMGEDKFLQFLEEWQEDLAVVYSNLEPANRMQRLLQTLSGDLLRTLRGRTLSPHRFLSLWEAAGELSEGQQKSLSVYLHLILSLFALRYGEVQSDAFSKYIDVINDYRDIKSYLSGDLEDLPRLRAGIASLKSFLSASEFHILHKALTASGNVAQSIGREDVEPKYKRKKPKNSPYNGNRIEKLEP